MKSLWDMIQALLFVIVAGAAWIAIPILGLLLGIASAVAIVFLVIQEDRKHPPD